MTTELMSARDNNRKIAEGRPEVVRVDAKVAEAYLGHDD